MSAIVLPKASRALADSALGGTPHRSPRSAPVLRRARGQIEAYLAGRRRELDFPVDVSAGTPFQRRVWRTIRRIRHGRVRSYGWVAGKLGGRRYARAVGLALGANPVPLIVPCHRVLASDGTLGGFGGGLRVKRKLLALEGAPVSQGKGKK